MIVYKITNKINGKVYIGQTSRTLKARWEQHIRNANKGTKTKFYNALRKYGADNFTVETLCRAYSNEELNDLEIYYIHKYDSIRTGYNMIDARYTNVMDFDDVKEKHRIRVQSEENRHKISESMKKKIADGKFFTEDHRSKLSQKAKGNKNGENNPSHSIPCYCIVNDTVTYYFDNYKEAGLWWYKNYHPFGEKYSQATYQRKIIDCIDKDYCTFKRKRYDFDKIKWYRGGDVK
jgi:group I intron endonuclease